MQNYLIFFSYKGTGYAGYQIQKNSNTVGAEILKALNSLFGSVTCLSGCSRTDSGVHASYFTASFKSEKVLAENIVIKALNNKLPLDITVFDCKYVSDDFHARYSVKSKEYTYKIYNTGIRSPFLSDFMFFYPKKLDIDLMNKAAQAFVGTYDFRAFMVSGSKVEDFKRTIYYAFFEKENDNVYFKISGDGFLYKMVRLIVGSLIYVSEGKLKADEIPEIIKSQQLTKAYAVPAHGLYLSMVEYERY